MKKRMISLFVCAVLIFGISLGTGSTAFAEDNVDVISAYRVEDTLYAFVSMQIESAGKVRASTQALGGVETEPVRYELSNVSSTYCVLLDTTISMNERIEEVNTFIVSLADNATTKDRVIVIPFQEKLIREEIIDTDTFAKNEDVPETLAKKLQEIETENADNNIYPCTIEALDYIDEKFPAGKGSITNLILITDSVDKNKVNQKSASEAKERVSASPEVIFHGVAVDSGEILGERFDGKGLSLKINRKSSGETAAKELLEFVSKLYSIELPQKKADGEARYSAEFYIKSWISSDGNEINSRKIVVDSVPLMEADEETGAIRIIGTENEGDGATEGLTEPKQPESLSQEETPANGESAPEEETPADGESAPAEVTAANGEEALPEEPEGSENPEATEDPELLGRTEDGQSDDENTEENDKDKKILIIAASAIGAVLIIALIAILVVKHKKHVAGNSGESIYMKLEVLSGDYCTKKRELELRNQLIIGRGRKCDIRFNEPEVSATNTRVFINNGMVYIEDMNSLNGTALEGMRIYSPNRLRSGNEISIGHVRFVLKF